MIKNIKEVQSNQYIKCVYRLFNDDREKQQAKKKSNNSNSDNIQKYAEKWEN